MKNVFSTTFYSLLLVFPLAVFSSEQSLTLTKISDERIARDGLTIEHYDKLLNGQAFQQNGIMTYKGYQYAVYWNSARHVCIYRKDLSTDATETIELSDYKNSLNDSHNTISMGICPTDGTIHLSFDHHDAELNYRISKPNCANNPDSIAWEPSIFGPVRNNFTGSRITLVTYPRFITAPTGEMLFECRIGSSGNGDAYLWEYDGSTGKWTSIGKYIDGVSSAQNPYLFGIDYDQSGRVHVTWCWRVSPDGSTNHDIFYAYSDDNGRTWYNNAGDKTGTSGSTPMTLRMTSLRVWEISQNRGFINQESQAVDSKGRIHVLGSLLPDGASNQSNFDRARSQAVVFHFYRDSLGRWHKNPLNVPAKSNRGQIAFDAMDNAYVALYNVRILGATAESNWTDWKMLADEEDNRFYSEVLIDKELLRAENTLSYFNPVRTNGEIYLLTYSIGGITDIANISGSGITGSSPRWTRTGNIITIDGLSSTRPYAIYSARGALVTQGHGSVINLENLTSGCYTIRLNGGAVKVVR